MKVIHVWTIVYYQGVVVAGANKAIWWFNVPGAGSDKFGIEVAFTFSIRPWDENKDLGVGQWYWNTS